MHDLVLKYDNDISKSVKLLSIFIGSVPIVGGVISGGINFANEKIVERRLQILLDRINNSELDLNDDLIKSDEFIHYINIVVNVISRTYSNEKIELFSKLISDELKANEYVNDFEGFEYFVKLIESVSYTELKILEIIFRADNLLILDKDGSDNTEEIIRLTLSKIKEYIKYNEDLIIGILDKLTYTGLLKKVLVNSFTYGAYEGTYYYKVSSLYYELRKKITITL